MGLTILPKLGYQPEQLKPEPVRIFTIKNILSLAALLVLGQWKYIRESLEQYRLIKKANSLVTEVKKATLPKGSGVPSKYPYYKYVNYERYLITDRESEALFVDEQMKEIESKETRNFTFAGTYGFGLQCAYDDITKYPDSWNSGNRAEIIKRERDGFYYYDNEGKRNRLSPGEHIIEGRTFLVPWGRNDIKAQN